MSRVGYSEDEDFPGQFNIWNANVMRSVRGRLGMAVLRDVEAALLALPRKRLVPHAVACDGDVCAVGAYLALKKSQADAVPMDEAVRRLEAEIGPDQENDDTDRRGIAAGMPRLVAWKLVALNDIEIAGGRSVWCEGPLPHEQAWRYRHGFRGYPVWVDTTPEERYEHVLSWVREQLEMVRQPPRRTPA